MLISGHLILPDADAPTPGWLRLAGDRIETVETGAPPGPPDLGGPDTIITPAFIDAHLHVPQIHAIGYDGKPLLEWLQTVIFPAETAWADRTVALEACRATLRRLTHHGTFGFAGYLTAHPGGLAAFAHAHAEQPLHAVVGLALTDRAVPPELARHPMLPPPPDTAPTLSWSLNPRFAVACSDDLMRRAAALARETAAERFIQTHLAETVAECDLVRELFPDAPNYASVYAERGLLTRRTLLAHAIHVTNQELDVIRAHEAVIVHCPTANTFLAAGQFDLARVQDRGVRVALGSDIAAGPDLAMPVVARGMIDVARHRIMAALSDAPPPTPRDAWRMITESNAEALARPDLGRLAPGATANLLVLRPDVPWRENPFGTLIYRWTPDWIVGRVLSGVALPSTTPPG